MPAADGRFRGISLAGLDIPWLEAEAEDLEAALCACSDGPCDLCVERGGHCVLGENCRCQNGETVEGPGW